MMLPIGGCMDYKAVQDIGKETMEYIKRVLEPGMSLIEVRKLCEDKMLELGADSFWYPLKNFFII